MAKNNELTSSDKITLADKLIKVFENESQAKVIEAEGQKEKQKTLREALKIQAKANEQQFKLGLAKVEREKQKDTNNYKIESFKTYLVGIVLSVFIASIIGVGIILLLTGKEDIGIHLIGYAATALLSAAGGAGYTSHLTKKNKELLKNVEE